MSQQRWEVALYCFNLAIKMRPSYHTPFFNIGRIMMVMVDEKYARTRQYDQQILAKAREAFDSAIRNYRIYTWAYLERGKCRSKMAAGYLMSKQAEPARQRLLEAVEDYKIVINLENNGRFGKDAQTLLKAVEEQLKKMTASPPPTTAPSP